MVVLGYILLHYNIIIVLKLKMLKNSVIFKECANLLISLTLQPHLPFDRRSTGVLLITTAMLVLQACFILLRYTIHQSPWNMMVICVILVMYHLPVKCYHCHKTIRVSKNMWKVS